MRRKQNFGKIGIIAAGIVIVAVVVIAAALLAQNPGLSVSGPGSSELTYKVPESSRQELVQSIEDGNERILIRSPWTIKWVSGDSGQFVAGVKNKDTRNAHNYNVNVYLDAFAGSVAKAQVESAANQWVTYSRILEIGPSEVETFDVELRPVNPQKGTYVFKVAVCDRLYGNDYETCHTISPGLYSQQSMSLYAVSSFTMEIN
jgi:hypothetical protein